MAIRTTDAAVQGIIDHDATISLTPFIEAASAVVDDNLVGVGHSATRLEQIERWLAAHFYTIRDKAVAQEGAKGVYQNFQWRLGLNMSVTMYGQQAMLLDNTGTLGALSKRMEAGIGGFRLDWAGTGDSLGNDTTK